MIEKIDNNQFIDILKDSPSKQTEPPKVPTNDNEVDASLQVNYDYLIEKAAEIPETDPSAVQRAQELLISGQLESLENIGKAAENMIIFGI